MLNRNLLKGAIVSKGLTQDKLADLIKMSANTLSSRMTGSSSFTVDEIDKICDVLDITSNDDKANIFLSCPSQKWENATDNQPQ